MNKQWTKNNTFILIGIILSILVIYGISYITIIQPIRAELSVVEQEASMYKKQIEKITNQKVDGIIDTELQKVALMIPNQKSLDNLLINLQKIASSSNINITYIATSGSNEEIEEEDEVQSIKHDSFILDATATELTDMNTFLDALRTSERLIRIDTIDLQQVENEVNLTVAFSVFYTTK